MSNKENGLEELAITHQQLLTKINAMHGSSDELSEAKSELKDAIKLRKEILNRWKKEGFSTKTPQEGQLETWENGRSIKENFQELERQLKTLRSALKKVHIQNSRLEKEQKFLHLVDATVQAKILGKGSIVWRTLPIKSKRINKTRFYLRKLPKLSHCFQRCLRFYRIKMTTYTPKGMPNCMIRKEPSRIPQCPQMKNFAVCVDWYVRLLRKLKLRNLDHIRHVPLHYRNWPIIFQKNIKRCIKRHMKIFKSPLWL